MDYFDRPQSGEAAVLVHIELPEPDKVEDFDEFIALVVSAGVEPVASITGNRTVPHARWFVGSGKLNEIQMAVDTEKVSLVLFNHALSPSQQRNLELTLKCRVIDRVGLILDIFAQRARTYEGKLQVELAQLTHLSTRLIRGWTHLERQKGGIGLRGPGETQLETDRRLIGKRIAALKKKLQKVKRQRYLGRSARQRSQTPTVSLVGYTNAGKSTLFHRLTHADVYQADQLFATLDPTLRSIRLPYLGKLVIADTVGFIRHLPPSLIESFNATLEEVVQSDLLLHVMNAAHPECDEQVRQVETVLQEIGAGDMPRIHVLNKIDAIDEEDWIHTATRLSVPHVSLVAVSAMTGEGIERLKTELTCHLIGTLQHLHIIIPAHLGAFSAFLYQQGVVKDSFSSIEMFHAAQAAGSVPVLHWVSKPGDRFEQHSKGLVQDGHRAGDHDDGYHDRYIGATVLEVMCGQVDWNKWLKQFNVQLQELEQVL